MNITELLVAGYHGDDPAFVVTLTPGEAVAVVTVADGDGDTAVRTCAHQTTDVFTAMRELLETLTPALSH